jgi:hypothetical protein
MLTEIAACGELFHIATGTAFADIQSMVTGKPGQSRSSASLGYYPGPTDALTVTY